jgi:hypothetical protein
MWCGFPASTMISPWFWANSAGVPDARWAVVTVPMFAALAEAKTSAGAPCLICVASVELPL